MVAEPRRQNAHAASTALAGEGDRCSECADDERRDGIRHAGTGAMVAFFHGPVSLISAPDSYPHAAAHGCSTQPRQLSRDGVNVNSRGDALTEIAGLLGTGGGGRAAATPGVGERKKVAPCAMALAGVSAFADIPERAECGRDACIHGAAASCIALAAARVALDVLLLGDNVGRPKHLRGDGAQTEARCRHAIPRSGRLLTTHYCLM